VITFEGEVYSIYGNSGSVLVHGKCGVLRRDLIAWPPHHSHLRIGQTVSVSVEALSSETPLRGELAAQSRGQSWHSQSTDRSLLHCR